MNLDEFKNIEIDLTPQIKSIQEKVANDLVNDIKSYANSALNRGYKRNPSPYIEGWTFKTENGVTIVYNQGNDKSLSHLLEFGHKSRSRSFVAPQPHIRPAYNIAKKKFEDEIKKIKINAKV